MVFEDHILWAKQGSNVLDLCCGSGDLAFLLSEKVGLIGQIGCSLFPLSSFLHSLAFPPKFSQLVTRNHQYLTLLSNWAFLNTLEVLDIWQKVDVVCFDVDSTVCVDEGIDELAQFCGAGKLLLNGLQDIVITRLSPGIKELVQKLKESSKTVYVISGGFRQVINAHGYKIVAMIGDGATTLEAQKSGCADLFICYGEVQLREVSV
ncbi:hypothetical protein L6452_22776 [Arctium lappa]|uniref:Uncharacterized protein n=1 Tax=Arctium lappa TaxID=4217 RepID=A0ACB9B0B6_ARCLA|nr:hypothetical protein L6452_22776 [Arctium lappa]